MRSCEFSVASGERKTLIITVGNIRFFRKNNTTIPHHSNDIFSAYGVTITFVVQKNLHLFDSVTQENSGDRQLNPVALAASLVWRIRAIPGSNDDTPICTYLDSTGKTSKISQTQVLNYLRATAFSIGVDKLGFSPMDIGNKSI